MTSAASAHANTAALYTWHVALPQLERGRQLAAARDDSLAQALDAAPQGSADARAIRVITQSEPPSAALCQSTLSATAGKLDPLIHAALLQRFALSVIDARASSRRGRRAATFEPSDAFRAISEALGIVDKEMRLLAADARAAASARSTAPAGPVDPASLLPPEIFAELTITFVRAALANQDATAARAATDDLEARTERIEQDFVRFHALTSVAIARLADSRPDDALVPAARARSLARQLGDLTGVWRAERIRAYAASAAGRAHSEEAAHREVAALARRLADDLSTTPSVRAEAALSELESRSVLARIALTSGRLALAEDQAVGMIDRAAKTRAAGDADPSALWEYEIDARVTRMIVAGLPESANAGRRKDVRTHSARGKRRAAGAEATGALTAGERASVYDARRTEARTAIATAHRRERALWWNTYVDDRHAYLLAANGRYARALRAAKRAHAGWVELGDADLAASSARDIAQLERSIAAGR